MIAVPVVCILGVLLWQAVGPAAPEFVDPNAQITALENQVDALRREYREVAGLIQREDANGEERASALEMKIQKWLEEWNAVFDPKRDANGELPAELAAGYAQGPAPVQQLRYDLIKITGF